MPPEISIWSPGVAALTAAWIVWKALGLPGCTRRRAGTTRDSRPSTRGRKMARVVLLADRLVPGRKVIGVISFVKRQVLLEGRSRNRCGSSGPRLIEETKVREADYQASCPDASAMRRLPIRLNLVTTSTPG